MDRRTDGRTNQSVKVAFRNDFVQGFLALFPRCYDEGKGEEEGDGGGVVEPEYTGVYRDRVRLDQPLEAAEYVQHGGQVLCLCRRYSMGRKCKRCSGSGLALTPPWGESWR